MDTSSTVSLLLNITLFMTQVLSYCIIVNVINISSSHRILCFTISKESNYNNNMDMDSIYAMRGLCVEKSKHDVPPT